MLKNPDLIDAIDVYTSAKEAQEATTVVLKKPADVQATLAERGARYGKFEDHARVSMSLKRAIYENCNKSLPDDMQEALDMICHKIGRIITGDHNYADSWHDIAGYASLVDQRLQGVAK